MSQAITPAALAHVERELNNRPWKCLGFKTPQGSTTRPTSHDALRRTSDSIRHSPLLPASLPPAVPKHYSA